MPRVQSTDKHKTLFYMVLKDENELPPFLGILFVQLPLSEGPLTWANLTFDR